MNSDQLIIDYLEDILDAIEKAEVFVTGMSFIEFKKDQKNNICGHSGS